MFILNGGSPGPWVSKLKMLIWDDLEGPPHFRKHRKRTGYQITRSAFSTSKGRPWRELRFAMLWKRFDMAVQNWPSNGPSVSRTVGHYQVIDANWPVSR